MPFQGLEAVEVQEAEPSVRAIQVRVVTPVERVHFRAQLSVYSFQLLRATDC